MWLFDDVIAALPARPRVAVLPFGCRPTGIVVFLCLFRICHRLVLPSLQAVRVSLPGSGFELRGLIRSSGCNVRGGPGLGSVVSGRLCILLRGLRCCGCRVGSCRRSIGMSSRSTGSVACLAGGGGCLTSQ
ncbi:hypothetical protein [Amycolatopsis thermophila]|uniref:Uncharacterized protein n=1 Tax=Amycolatopsis thermophila TaxID=206084 RepID=A0ABU0F1W5_9PSEU|nr:hypothetical protein [Amycolatopsis thermophila]MDQ0381552.1 hypothetical protein [Amycolatopsis thermophila]